MPRLTPHWAAHLESGVSHRLGGSHADGQPEICRGLAAQVLADGRIVMVYGNRLRPPRAWEVSPGVVGTLYCYNPRDDAVQVKPPATGAPWGAGGVRFMARSFFSVD